MEGTARVIAPPARLTLPGHAATPARAEMLYRPGSVRLTRSLLPLVGFWAITPLVFFIPPHLPWALATFTFGIYFAWVNWRGAYEVRALEGDCPRCGKPLSVKPGTKVRLPHRITCYECHHDSQLEMGVQR